MYLALFSTHRCRIFPAFLLALLMAGPALAAPISDKTYAETMRALDELETRMIEVIAKFEAGMTPQEATALKPEFDERLVWLREVKREAAQAGVATSHTKLKAALYPRCIVLRSGMLDPYLQDLTVNLARNARNNPYADYIAPPRKLHDHLHSDETLCPPSTF